MEGKTSKEWLARLWRIGWLDLPPGIDMEEGTGGYWGVLSSSS